MSESEGWNEDRLIYDWNSAAEGALPADLELYDETLRDGIQCPSVVDPSIEDKVEILRLQEKVGIHATDIGLPGAGPRAVADVTRLAEVIRDEGLKIHPTCAARTHERDVGAVIDISQKTGLEIEVMAFLGSSPIRMWTEGWDLDRMVKLTLDAVALGVRNGLPVTFVTEDTVRSNPETLRTLFKVAIDAGAQGLCLCDTCGHATPTGVRGLLSFAQEVIEETGADIRLDWHGHEDRGLSLVNAVVAAQSGAKRIHGCALGIGERVGNTPMDLLIVNLRLMGLEIGDPSYLPAYIKKVSEATERDIPVCYPVFGDDAFRTGTGVHAAAVIKAMKKGDHWLADRIYSGVPAGDFGLHQIIEVGPMSGMSNVLAWMSMNGFGEDQAAAGRIFEAAKAADRLLSDKELSLLARG